MAIVMSFLMWFSNPVIDVNAHALWYDYPQHHMVADVIDMMSIGFTEEDAITYLGMRVIENGAIALSLTEFDA